MAPAATSMRDGDVVALQKAISDDRSRRRVEKQSGSRCSAPLAVRELAETTFGPINTDDAFRIPTPTHLSTAEPTIALKLAPFYEGNWDGQRHTRQG